MKKLNGKNESRLVKAVRNSDEKAFQILFQNYAETIYAFLYTRIRSEELARDLVQDVFTRFWTHRHTLNPDLGCRAYLYRIADRLLIDHYRKQGSRNTYQREMEHQDSNVPDLELQITLQDTIHNLPETLRQVFILSRYEGYTYQEIAEICEVSIKTVEKRMSEVLKILRDRLSR